MGRSVGWRIGDATDVWTAVRERLAAITQNADSAITTKSQTNKPQKCKCQYNQSIKKVNAKYCKNNNNKKIIKKFICEARKKNKDTAKVTD